RILYNKCADRSGDFHTCDSSGQFVVPLGSYRFATIVRHLDDSMQYMPRRCIHDERASGTSQWRSLYAASVHHLHASMQYVPWRSIRKHVSSSF
ncbi:hypothetical protein LTS18_012868, partial [Coniosporium uncinatum]